MGETSQAITEAENRQEWKDKRRENMTGERKNVEEKNKYKRKYSCDKRRE